MLILLSCYGLEEQILERQRLESQINELQGRNQWLQATVDTLQQQKPIKVCVHTQSLYRVCICEYLFDLQEVVKVPYPVPIATPTSTMMSPITPGTYPNVD